MNHKKYLYSSGEFAKFTGINKRTLHYYNEIGLFCPEVIGENDTITTLVFNLHNWNSFLLCEK